jgi:hypothetical protein
VIVQVVPPSLLLNGVPTNLAAFVGTASYGPVNAPTPISAASDLIANFATPVARMYDLGTQAYVAMQQGANNLLCVRVTDGTDTAAAATLRDEATAIGAYLTAKYTGSYPNSDAGNLKATISQGATLSTYKLTLYLNNGIPEVFDNIGGSGAAFWSNLVNAINLGQSQIRGPSQLCTAATGNAISSVSVTTAGSYATLPTLGTSGPGTGAVLNATMKVVSATVAAAGTGYAPADTITLTGGSHTINGILNVATTKLVSVAVNAGGSNYLVGDTITLAGGTFGTAAVLTVATVSTGAITGVTITNAGSYTANSATFTQGSTSGVGSGATFNTGVFGVNTLTLNTAGAYTALPSSPVAQGSTSGSGIGATAVVLWGLLSIQVANSGSGFTAASALLVTGGGGTGGATGSLVLGSAAAPALETRAFDGGTDGADNITSATLVGSDVSPRTGMYSLRNKNAAILVLADATDAAQWQYQSAFGLSEAIYVMGVEQASLQENVAEMISQLQGAAIQNYDFKLLGGDWMYFADPFNNVTRLVSPQGYVAGILAVTPPNGSSLNKAMNAVVATQKSYDQRVYSDAELQALITAGVDIVTKPIPLSPNLFGVRLGCNTSANPVTKFDNYPRMVNFLGRTIVTGMGMFIGEPQTSDVQRAARSTLMTFLSNLQQLGWIDEFSVVLNDSNNPQNQKALGYMQASVRVQLQNIIQNLVVNVEAGGDVNIQVLPPQLLAA